MADGVFTVDREGRITSFNRAAEEITGYAREEVVGRPCQEVFQTGICKERCALRHTVASGERLVNMPVEIVCKSGERVPVSISTAVLHDRAGQRLGGVETFRDMTALAELRQEVEGRQGAGDIVGSHPKLREVLDILPEVAQSVATVLVQGPSGSGKGLLAATLHHLSPRGDGPFVKVNCAALPETLLESELFGYVKGAFTDAKKDKPGRIALAEGGTLFLDEIGDVTPAVQVKLLRVVQDREYEPLGSSTTRKADVRVVAATNRDLSRMMEEGLFREDLYYRLAIVSLTLPSLAERRDDIPRLVTRLLARLNARTGKNVTHVSERAMDLLMRHDYPGNVRELENALEHALVLCRGSVVEEKHLPITLRHAVERSPRVPLSPAPLRSAEAETISRALTRFKGDRQAVADALGIHRTTLWRKMKRHGLA